MYWLDILRSFDSNKVDYALVGGWALALHGAVRGTVDIDLAVSLAPEDLKQAEAILNEHGLTSRLPINASELSRFRQEYIEKRNLIAWSFVNNKKPSEIIDLIITVDARALEKTERSYKDTAIKIASIPELIKMKELSPRQQDQEDVKALKMLLESGEK